MSLKYTDLINYSLKSHIENMRDSGDKETITFYIEDHIGEMYINRYFSEEGKWVNKTNSILINNVGHSDFAKEYIRNIYNELDKIIDLDFQEQPNNDGSQVDIYAISSSSSFKENTVGQVIQQETDAGGWFDLFWKKNIDNVDINSLEKNTIIHEIGHTLGLSHPKNDPTNIKWDTEDTVMSYNKPDGSWSDWFSRLDILALKNMWGRENDDGSIDFLEKSEEYKFQKTSEDHYLIQTPSGSEDITNIKTLNFEDKSLDVFNDIICVFNQITGKDDITGQVFRLYNSAFSRIPDKTGFEYWIKMGKEEINTYEQIGLSFLNSSEFKEKYGENTSNKDYITNLYLNIFDRSPDTIGYDYWLGRLDARLEDRAQVLMGFSESVESKLLFTETTNIH